MKTLLTTAALASALACGSLHAVEKPIVPPVLPVAALNPPASIKGVFGKPIGTRLVIEGTYNIQMMSNARVTTLDGVPLDKPILIQVHSKAPIDEGKPFHLEGYESGAFDGPPGWLPGMPQQSFQFYKFFVVTKVL
jgi:hypothetical protein